MKYLLIFVLVFIVAWRWRASRSAAQLKLRAKDAQKIPVEMVKCHHCGVHLAATDALGGEKGHYCCVAHRLLAEP